MMNMELDVEKPRHRARLSVFDRIDETTELIDWVIQNKLTEPDS